MTTWKCILPTCRYETENEVAFQIHQLVHSTDAIFLVLKGRVPTEYKVTSK